MTDTEKSPRHKKEACDIICSASTPNEAPPNENCNHAKASAVRNSFAIWNSLINRPDLGFEETYKRKLFAALILPGVIILFLFAIYHLSRRGTVEGILDLAACIWLLATLVAFRITANGLNLYRFNSVVLGCLFVFLSIKGGVDGNKLMWSFSFPLIALYTLGRKEGFIATTILYGLLIAVLYVPVNFVRVHAYAPEFKVRFCVAFFLVAALTYIYESVRESIQSNLEGERNKLEAEKSKLARLSNALQEVNQAIELSKERLTRAQVIARVGNLEYQVSTGMLWGSPEALRILGVDAPDSEFPLSNLEHSVPEFEAFRKDLEECIRNKREYDRELTIERLSDGKTVVLHVKAEVVCDAAGDAVKVIGVIQDVSDRKEADREKRQLEERLARAQKMESLGLLAGGVAHDLNNVLSGVVGYPDLLLRNLPAESAMAKPLQKIQESGQKAAAIVQDLLTLARRGVTNHKVLNLNDIIVEFMTSPEQTDIQSWHAAVSFKTHLDPELLNIRGSEVHLKKTILNLISNAAESLPAGGTVQVHTENRYVEETAPGNSEVPEGEYAVLRIEDNGIGISAEDLSRIFEPFYTKKKMGRSGTGLGMSVVWGTVQDHQGHIHIDSAEGEGTRVVVYFPATREPAADRERVVPLDEYVGHGETILVVDDVLEQRELAQNMLTKLGYDVHTAAGGEAALDLMSGRSVDLVILDMIMDPGMDGLETYLRILESNPTQRAIIVSGYSETDWVRKAQRLGAKVYVKKPYTLEKLGMAVRQALNC